MIMKEALFAKLKKQFKDKRVLIVGLGLLGGGVGLAKFFCNLGAQVIVTDAKKNEELLPSIVLLKEYPVKYILGKHRMEDFVKADFIFKGPSVPWTLPGIIEAEKKGIPVEMEASFFASLCQATIIGITGTRGKSTVAMMVYEILKNNLKNVYLGGNVSHVSTINLLNQVVKESFVVMELSSWALSGFHRKKISPHIAIFTNFFPDHLNYYKNMNDYLYDKKAIYLYQKPEDYLILNESLLQFNIKSKSKMVFYKATDFPYESKYIKGKHNNENAAAAFRVAEVLRLDRGHAGVVIKQFKGLPFRQEIIGQKEKVVFINDSTSTTPVATIAAIETFSDRPIYLILGGNAKNLPLNTLINQLIKVKKIILLKGLLTNGILPILRKKYSDKLSLVYDDLERATQEAYRLAKNANEEAYVLFSPGATSFSMFKNEFDRGESFTAQVKKIV